MVVTPCLTVKSHPVWSLVTEPSVCTKRACGFLFCVKLLSLTDSDIRLERSDSARKKRTVILFLMLVDRNPEQREHL